ncbi:MAG: cupredoxin family copper-binding protein [Actinomycetota bacterium]|nr:cupredoxin family copper-binding protein [Actinomycetota bacterium]
METTDVFLDPHVKSHRRNAALSLAATAAAAILTLTACSSNSGYTAQGAPPPLTPGAGQSLAGLPGSTATGAASGTTTMPPMTMPSTSGEDHSSQAPVAGDAVSIKNFAFAPTAMTVKVGTTVTWTNKDSDAHTVTSTGGGGPLKSSPLNTGQSYTHTFTAVGTYSYFCTIHPFMTATVTVTA